MINSVKNNFTCDRPTPVSASDVKTILVSQIITFDSRKYVELEARVWPPDNLLFSFIFDLYPLMISI